MSKAIITGGGGGADLDAVTAKAPDVLSGKVIVDQEGEPLTGTMPANGSQDATLNCGESRTIPGGYTPGGTVTANSLASQTPGNADAGAILSGRNAWANGNNIGGGIPLQYADVAGSDRAWATNVSAWGGTMCLGVRNGHYLSGVNWIQGDLPGLQPGNVREGVNIGGVAGTLRDYSYLVNGQVAF